MKKAKVIISLLVLVSILNISVVCFADDKQPGTFTQLRDKITTAINEAGSAQEIFVELDNNYKFDYDVDYDLYEGIVIEKSVIINGNGFTIDGDNQARMFMVAGQSTVTFNNVVFKNGYGGIANYSPRLNAHFGGAIIVKYNSTLNVNSCEFIENCADNGYGSAIFITGDSSLNATDCEFKDNGDDNTAVVYAIDGNTINIYCSNLAASDIQYEKGDMGYEPSIYLYTMPQIEFTVSNHTYGSNANLVITQPAGFNGTASILTTENDPIENVKFTNGKASVNINLLPGTYTASIATDEYEYAKDDTGHYHYVYLGSEGASNEFTVLSSAAIKVGVANITYGAKAVVKGTVNATGTVTIKVSGKVVANGVAINNGAFAYTIPNILNAGTYTVEAVYNGNATTAKATASTRFTVGKLNTKIDAASINTTYNKTRYATACLKDSNGKALINMNITVIMNGKTKTYKTDSKGKIAVPITDLKPKTYSVTFKFAGSDKYNPSNSTAKITMSKASAKITAANKTYKRTAKTKKYNVTLKNSSGKAIANAKISIKVNGRTYNAKTNAKGTASFTLKMAKTGTYKTIIKYSGNNLYKSANKTVKITIK